MDNEATVMRQQMDETLARLTDKLGKLEHQVSGTVRTVKDSVNTVRDTFDLKRQVRRRPWALLAGAMALGFLYGSRSNGCARPTRNGRSASAPLARVADAEHPCAVANDGTNGADAARSSAPGWLANLGGTFQPEIAALRGIALGTVLELVREAITKPAPKPMGDANKGSNVTLEDQEGISR